VRTGRIAAAAVVGAGVVAATALARALRGVEAPAAGDIRSFLALPLDERERRPVVAALGASIVRGRASVDFVRMLREELPDLAFVNGGVNGRVAWELLSAMDDVMACHPSAAIILVGTNDVEATLDPDGGQGVQQAKGLPEAPSIDFYGECLTGIVDRLHDGGARVAVCSLPPLGQDLGDMANQRTHEFNRVIAVVCESRRATYLPVNERMADMLRHHGADAEHPFTGSWRPGLESLLWHFVGRQSFDDISRRQGMLLSPDGVHLNTMGAQVVADLAAEFLAAG